MRVVFLGTPAFALPTLEAVAREHEVSLAIAQPDRPAGRGMKMHRPPVAARAAELGLPVRQPTRIRDENVLAEIAASKPDVGVVVAYGKILPARLLSIPRHGFLNVHASLLPKYRGAAPIQRAIQSGESATGVTIMRVDEELDHGPILRTVALPIGPDEHHPQLAARLSALGAEAMTAALADLERGQVTETPQDHDRASYAPKIEKDEGLVTFEEPAASIYNRFRAFDPWPGVWFTSHGEAIKIVDMQPVGSSAPPRVVVAIDDGVVVGTGDGAMRMSRLQRSGKSGAAAADVARGLGWRAGEPLP